MATRDGVLHLAVDDLTVITCHKACRTAMSLRYLKTGKLRTLFCSAPDASLARQAGTIMRLRWQFPLGILTYKAYINASRVCRRLHFDTPVQGVVCWLAAGVPVLLKRAFVFFPSHLSHPLAKLVPSPACSSPSNSREVKYRR